MIDKILNKLGLVRKADADKAMRAVRRQWNNDSRLAATLMEECQRLQRDNDELSDENARLIEENNALRAETASKNRG